jgi:hypothetical protein
MRITKHQWTIIQFLFFGLACVLYGSYRLYSDVNLNLSKQLKAREKVVQTGYERVDIGFRYRHQVEMFSFELEGIPDRFVIDQYYPGYESKKTAIKVGDTLKVFYRKSSDYLNGHVYQVEKDGKVLVSYAYKNEKYSTAAAILLLVGSGFIFAGVLKLLKLNLITLLLKVVR